MSVRIRLPGALLPALLAGAVSASWAGATTLDLLLDQTGDGTHEMFSPNGIAVDSAGSAFVAAESRDNAFRIDPDGTITQIIDATGDGANVLDRTRDVAVGPSGNAYVGGWSTDNVFRITPGGTITEIIDASGAGGPAVLNEPWALAVDGAENVYVTGRASDNVFKITPGGVVTEILDANGDGFGNPLERPTDVAVDAAGNVYVVGQASDNLFKVTPGGTVTRILGPTGNGAGTNYSSPASVAVTPGGTVYVTNSSPDSIFRVTPAGAISVFALGGETGIPLLDNPFAIALDATENVYVTTLVGDRLLRITQSGDVRTMLGPAGDGTGELENPIAVATGAGGAVYVVGEDSHTAFRLVPVCPDMPMPGCGQPAEATSGRLILKAGILRWTWNRGSETLLGDFGDPLTSASHSVCAYDESGLAPSLAFEGTAQAGGICSGRPCWRLTSKGYKFRDKAAAPDGIKKVLLFPGAEGAARILAKGKGDHMSVPPLPLALPFRVQMQGSHGECWEAAFFEAGAKRNDPTVFKGIAGSPSGAFLVPPGGET